MLRAADQMTSYATGIPVIDGEAYVSPFDFRCASDDGSYQSNIPIQKISRRAVLLYSQLTLSKLWNFTF